jgi:ribosomal-protein-alanine N-acetyltransferase
MIIMNVQKLFAEAPVFETKRLLLRNITMDDATDYFDFASDPQVSVFTTWDTHQTIAESQDFIHKVLGKYETKSAYHWGIIDKSTGKLIGRTGFIRWDADHQKTEISSRYWNQGVITEATKNIIKYGFEKLDLNRIEGRCNHNNVGSGRVMEKLGMKFEGTLREQMKIKGEFVDQRMYAILNKDFSMSN